MTSRNLISHVCETRKLVMAILHWKQGLSFDKMKLAEDGQDYGFYVTCRNVLAPGARVFRCTDITGNRDTLIAAPTAYQKEPDMPL